ncbi:cation-transporting P-type ATPase [Porticoccus sp.]
MAVNTWHHQTQATVLGKLEATSAGLSEEEVSRRRATYGPNCLPEPAGRSLLLRLLLQFHNLLIYVLLGSALVTAVLGHLVDTLVILAVVMVNAVIGVIQEGKAQCHCPEAANHRNPGLGLGDLYRQDRHPDPQRNECDGCCLRRQHSVGGRPGL